MTIAKLAAFLDFGHETEEFALWHWSCLNNPSFSTTTSLPGNLAPPTTPAWKLPMLSTKPKGTSSAHDLSEKE
jgi:hypothetical protein